MTEKKAAPKDPPSTALSTIGPAGLAPTIGGRSLQEMKSWLAELRAFVKDILVEGVDFGVVPGVGKPFLWKPGAEKLCLLYGLAPEFHPLPEDTIRDWTANPPQIQLAYRCDLVQRATGMKVGEGFGVCSSWEQKYRYRAEWWKGPGDPPPNEGWKKTKSGPRRQTINPDISDSINTIMKIAQKRAQIDAVLRATATSEVFTQDEDAPHEDAPRPPEPDAEIEKKVNGIVEAIQKAADFPALQELSKHIAGQGPGIAKHARVRGAYKQRHHELKPADAAAPVAAETKATEGFTPPPQNVDQRVPKADPKVEREPGADEDEEFSDPGPDES